MQFVHMSAPTHDLAQFSSYRSIGQQLRQQVKKDIKEMDTCTSRMNMKSLIDYSPSTWLGERPKELIALLESLFDCKVHDGQDNVSKVIMPKVVEQVYKGVNTRIVLPLSFRENMLSYSASTCKKLVNYDGQTSAGGSYTHLLNWLSDQASDLIPIPNGLVKSVIDNEQVVIETHTVKADNKVPMIVLTSHAYQSIDAASSIQKDKSLKPSEWLFQDPSQELKQDILNYGEKSAPYFRTTRNAWIAS